MTGTGPGTAPEELPPPNAQGTAPEGSSLERGRIAAPEEQGEAVSAWLRVPGTTLKPRVCDVEWDDGGSGGGI